MAENLDELYSNLSSDERFKSLFETQDEFEQYLANDPSADQSMENIFGIKSASEYLKKKDQPIIQNLAEESSSFPSLSAGPIQTETETTEVVEQPIMGVPQDNKAVEAVTTTTVAPEKGAEVVDVTEIQPIGQEAVSLSMLEPLGYGKGAGVGPQTTKPPGKKPSDIIVSTGTKVWNKDGKGIHQNVYLRLYGEIEKLSKTISTDPKIIEGKINEFVSAYKELKPDAEVKSDFDFIINQAKTNLAKRNISLDVSAQGAKIAFKKPEEKPITFDMVTGVVQKGPFKPQTVDQILAEKNKPVAPTQKDLGIAEYLDAYDRYENNLTYKLFASDESNAFIPDYLAVKLAEQEPKVDKLIQDDINKMVGSFQSNLSDDFFDMPALITTPKSAFASLTDIEKGALETKPNPNRKLTKFYGIYFINDAGNVKVNPVFLEEQVDQYLKSAAGPVTPALVKKVNEKRKSFGLSEYSRDEVIEIMKPRFNRLAKIASQQKLSSEIINRRMADVNLFKEDVGKVNLQLSDDIKDLTKKTEKLVNDYSIHLVSNAQAEVNKLAESVKQKNQIAADAYKLRVQSNPMMSSELQASEYQNYLKIVNDNATAYEEQTNAIKKQVDSDLQAYKLQIQNSANSELEQIKKKYGIVSDKDEKGQMTTAAYRKYRDAYKKEYDNLRKEEEMNSDALGLRLTDIIQSSSARMFGNSIEAITAAVGYEDNPLTGLLKYLDLVQVDSEVYVKPFSKVLKEQGFFSGEAFKSIVQNTVQQVPTLAVGIAASALSGNPFIGGGIMFAQETTDQVGENYKTTFERTGSLIKAENAAAETLETQIKIAPLYTISMLPFTKGFLSKIAPGTGFRALGLKAGAGIALELTEEVPIEIAQNYLSYKFGTDNPESFSSWVSQNGLNTAIDVLPTVAVLGGSSALMENYRERQTEQAKSRVMATLGRLGMVQNISDAAQVVGSKGVMIIPEYLYRTGQINDAELKDMRRAFEDVVKELPNAQELVKDQDAQKYYVTLATEKLDTQRKIAESKDENLKKLLEEKVKSIDKKLADVAAGKPLQITKITFKNGSTIVADNSQMQSYIKNPKFLDDITEEGAKVESSDSNINKVVEETKKQKETQAKEATDKGAKQLAAVETTARETGATIQEQEKLSAIAERARQSGQKNVDTVLDEASTLQRALNEIAPGAKIVFLNNDDYVAAMQQVKGRASSAGNFSYRKNEDGTYSVEVQINLDKATTTTLAHEVGHGILLRALGSDPKLFNDMRTRLKKTIEGTIKNESLKQIEALVDQYSNNEKGEEFLVELAAVLKQSEKQIEIATLEKIAKVIADFVAYVTGGTVQIFDDIRTRADYVDFVNGMVETLRTGQITQGVQKKIDATKAQPAAEVTATEEVVAPAETAVEEGVAPTETQVEQETKPTETLEQAGEMNEGTMPFTPGPVEVDVDFLSKSQLGEKIIIPTDDLLGGKQVDVIEELKRFKEENGRNPKIWFWMADQLKRGIYENPKTGVTHFLEGGFNFANDPKNIENGEIWATGLDEKLLNTRLPNADYIWFMAGSPNTSFNFSKGTSKVLIKEIEEGLKRNLGKRVEGVLINNGTFDEFIKVAEKILPSDAKKWNEFLTAIRNPNMLDTSARKIFAETLLHEGGDKKITLPFQQFVHQQLGVPTQAEFLPLLREKFLVDNNFKNGDMGILVKPNGEVKYNSNTHDTYKNSILGDVVGFPTEKINIKNVLPEEALQVVSKETNKPIEKPSEPAIIKTAVGDLGKIYEGEQLKGFKAKPDSQKVASKEIKTNEDFEKANQDFGIEDGKVEFKSKSQYTPKELSTLSETISNRFDQTQLENLKGLINPGVTAPQNTTKAYKLFKVKRNFPGELFPLFVGANESVTTGEWIQAKAGELTQTKEGKTMVKSTLGPLAYRPGWHSGEFAIATHIGNKKNVTDKAPNLRADDQVWAEVEVGNDFDWQTEANNRAEKTKDGKISPRTAHITDQIPLGGNYKYKTNSNMTGSWIISGEMKVNRILTDAEVEQINKESGSKDLPRTKPFDFAAFGFNQDGTVSNPKQVLSNQIARAYLNAKETGTNQELIDAVDMKAPETTGEFKSKSQLDFTQIRPEYDAIITQTNGDKVAAYTGLVEKGYTPKRIKEAIGLYDFDEAAFKQAQSTIAINTMDKVGTAFSDRQESIKQAINNNLGNIEAIYGDLIDQGYSNLEIFTAARDMDFLSPQDLIDVFGADYRQTVQNALNRNTEYPADFLDELEADAQNLKVSQKATEVADVVRNTGVGLVDSAVAIDSFLDYLKTNGFDQIAIALSGAVKQFANDRNMLKKEEDWTQADLGDKLYSPEAINYAFNVSSELFSQAGRILQLARYFNEANQLAVIEKQLAKSNVVLTENQKKTLEALVNDYKAAQKDNKAKREAFQKDWSDQAYQAFWDSEKAVGIATIKIAQFLEARKPIFWNDRVTSGSARALLNISTTVLSVVANVENNIWSTNYATRTIQKLRDLLGSGIKGNTLSFSNWQMARKLTSDRMWFDMNNNAKYGVLDTSKGLNKYYDNLAQVNFFKDAQWAYNFMKTMVKNATNKDFETLTPEEQADAFDMTLVKLKDGTIELRDGKTYTLARSLAWTLGTGPMLARMRANPFLLLNTGGPIAAEVTGRAMAYGGDIAFGYMAAQRAMIDYFQNIQGTRFQNGVFDSMLADADGNLDQNALRAMSQVLYADAELYSRFETEGLKRTLLANNIISSTVSLGRGALRKTIRGYYQENRVEIGGADLASELKRQFSMKGLAKNSLQLIDVALFTLMPFTKVPVNFLGSAIMKVVPGAALGKYILSESLYQGKWHTFKKQYSIGTKIKTEKEKRDYEKAKIDLFFAKRQATYDAAQAVTSVAIYTFAMSAVKAGAVLTGGGDDPEKEKALKKYGLRGGLYNATLHWEYIKAGMPSNFLARRGGYAKEGDVILNTRNAGFLGYAFNAYGTVYDKQRKEENDNTTRLFSEQTGAIATILSTALSSGIEDLPMFSGLARVGQVLTDLKSGESSKKAFENFAAGSLSTSMAVFFPSFFSFMSKGNAEIVQNASDIITRTEKPDWPAFWSPIGLRVVQKLNRNISFNEETRNEFYDAAIGPFGEDLSSKVTLAEPGTAGAYFQAIFDPFTFRSFSSPAKQQQKEIQKYRESMEVHGGMINLALIYQQMTGRDYEWTATGKTSGMFGIISNPMKNNFAYTQEMTLGGDDAANVYKGFNYQLPNDLYRQELKNRGDYFQSAFAKYGQRFKDVLIDVQTNVEKGDIETAKSRIVNIFNQYQDEMQKAKNEYMLLYRNSREKDYLIEMKKRNLFTPEEIQKMINIGLANRDGLIL